MKKKRLRGITFFAYAFLVMGALAVYRQTSGVIGYYRAFGSVNLAYLLCVIRDIGFIIAGAGVLYLKSWSRYLTIAVSLLSLSESICDVTFYLSGGPQTQAGEFYGVFIYTGIIVNSITLYYFSRSKIKEQFK